MSGRTKFTQELSLKDRRLSFAPDINVRKENGHRYIVKVDGSFYCVYDSRNRTFYNEDNTKKEAHIPCELKERILSIIKAFE